MNFEISVIIPVRNEEKYIGRCLTSLANQTYPHDKFEVIVIDGESTDNTRKLVESFRKSLNLSLLDNPQHSTPTGLNIGLRVAKGQIIIRVDGHAAVESDYIEQCMHYLQKTGATAVCGFIHSEQTTRKGTAIALGMSSVFGVGNARFRVSGEEGEVDTGAFLAYRREIFEEIGLFHEHLVYAEDDEFHYRMRGAGATIFFTPKIRSRYFTRANYRELFTQYFRYGRAKVNVLRLHTRMMQPRQFAPPALVLLLASGLLYPFLGLFSLAAPAAYFSGTLLASTIIAAKEGTRYLVYLPQVLWCLHVGYGIGFLAGLPRLLARPAMPPTPKLVEKLGVS